jgi:hypothetical protein
MRNKTFICWALRDEDELFDQGFGYPILYATEEQAERDIRNPHLNPIQVEVVVRPAFAGSLNEQDATLPGHQIKELARKELERKP